MASQDDGSFSCCSCRAPRPGRDAWRAGSQSEKQDPWNARLFGGDWSWAKKHHGTARRKNYHHRSSSRTRSFISLTVFLLTLLSLSLIPGAVAAASSPSTRRRAALTRFARTEELLVDRREPPIPRMRLLRRQDEASTSSRSGPSAAASTQEPSVLVSTVAIAPSNSLSPSSTRTAATTTSLTTDATSTSTSLPRPFDTSLGNNFTSTSCPNFFNKFLSDGSFMSCLPFSLLLQTSNSFFVASKSLVRITQTLDATCQVDFNKCNALMGSLAQQLKSSSNCGADYTAQNPLVLQAYDGLIAYQPLYQAGCLRDSKGNYCYANAITNTSSTTDSYPYYLPLGNSLPGGSRPTCNACLQDTMAVFAAAASNATQPVSRTYGDAAQQINMGCGPNFVNSSIAVKSGGSRVMGHGAGMESLAALVVTLLALIL